MNSLKNSVRGHIKSFLTFNYAERRGIVVLVFLILIVEAVNAFLPALISKPEVDLNSFEAEYSAFVKELRKPDTLQQQQKKPPIKKYKPKFSSHTKKAESQQPLMIEINTADTAQLIKLRGIGPVFAGRILNYRALLGGFFSCEQLMEVYGMDSLRYDGIRNNVHASTSFIKKIDINNAEFKKLLRHPYLDYETVKVICNYRDRTGPITCEDTLRKIIAYEPMFEKIRYYIEYRTMNPE